MLRQSKWAESTEMTPYKNRSLSSCESTTLKLPPKAGNALATPLVFWVSIGSTGCLPSGDPAACFPAYLRKKEKTVYLGHLVFILKYNLLNF